MKAVKNGVCRCDGIPVGGGGAASDTFAATPRLPKFYYSTVAEGSTKVRKQFCRKRGVFTPCRQKDHRAARKCGSLPQARSNPWSPSCNDPFTHNASRTSKEASPRS